MGIAAVRSKIEVGVDARLAGQPAWVVVVELFLGFGWLRAAVEKILSSRWWSGDPIREFAAEHAEQTLPYYRPVIEHIISPTIVIVAVATVVLQLVIAGSILTGYKIGYGLLIATALNINILIAGGVDPSIFYLMLQAALLLWLVETRWFGLDVRRFTRWTLAGAVLLFVSALPFVGTLEPKGVIDDPGAVLATYGACVAAGCLTALRNDPAAAAADRSVPAAGPRHERAGRRWR